MGGIIYTLNAVKILNFLEDEDKPEVFVFYPERVNKFIDEINYPYLHKIGHDFPSVPKGFIKSFLSGKNVFVHDIIKEHELDGVFPMHDFPVKSKQKAKQISWYADLQHKYYPEFFAKKKLVEREIRIRYILKNATDLVVSSQAVKDDFLKFYNIPDHLKIHIYRFVSIIDELPEVKMPELLKQNNLPKEYFMVSNQFHKHKNHQVVFKALAILKKEGKKVHIAFSGKFPNQPDSPYIQELHDLINKHELSSQITFLGLIPRGEQLVIMKNAIAIIQPSLFEGWSTVIEDARSLQVPVIASDLPVNIEQLG